MSGTSFESSSGTGPAPRPRLERLLSGLIAGFAIPLLVYFLARPQLGSDVAALGLAGVCPILWTAIVLKRRHRVEPIAAQDPKRPFAWVSPTGGMIWVHRRLEPCGCPAQISITNCAAQVRCC